MLSTYLNLLMTIEFLPSPSISIDAHSVLNDHKKCICHSIQGNGYYQIGVALRIEKKFFFKQNFKLLVVCSLVLNTLFFHFLTHYALIFSLMGDAKQDNRVFLHTRTVDL